MLEPFGQLLNVFPREQFLKVCWFRRVTAQDFYFLPSFQHPWNFIACHNYRHFAGRTSNPFRNFTLGMRVGSINLIQYQTQRHLVSSKEGRNTSGMLTGLRQSLNIGKTAHGLRCINFQDFESTGPRSSQSDGCLSNPWRAMQQNGVRKRRRSKVGLESRLDIHMSQHSF